MPGRRTPLSAAQARRLVSELPERELGAILDLLEDGGTYRVSDDLLDRVPRATRWRIVVEDFEGTLGVLEEEGLVKWDRRTGLYAAGALGPLRAAFREGLS